MTEAINPSYERVQQEAKGPGVEEWRQADKLRAQLSASYESLRDDERYASEYKAATAWKRYEETKDKIEKLAPEARQKMLRSAETLERLSIPTPNGEGLITKDTNKLLLTAHERSRIEGLINRAEKAAVQGPFKANPIDVLRSAYEQGLEVGGPGGGATVRAVVGVAKDWGLDVNDIVDSYRRDHHRGALADAEAARWRAQMVGRGVPEPPFKKGGGSTTVPGAYNSSRRGFIPRERPLQFKKGRPSWK